MQKAGILISPRFDWSFAHGFIKACSSCQTHFNDFLVQGCLCLSSVAETHIEHKCTYVLAISDFISRSFLSEEVFKCTRLLPFELIPGKAWGIFQKRVKRIKNSVQSLCAFSRMPWSTWDREGLLLGVSYKWNFARHNSSETLTQIRLSLASRSHSRQSVGVFFTCFCHCVIGVS